MIRFVLILLLAGAAAAQPRIDAAPSAQVRVDAPAGTVLVEGVVAGPVGAWLRVDAGSVEIALVDDPAVWNPRRASAALTLASGDSLTVHLTLPRRVRVETVPLRAVVVREGPTRDTLGTAPLTLDLGPGEPAALVASLDGYASARAQVGLGTELVTLVLSPIEGAAPILPSVRTERGVSRRTWVDVGIGAAAIAAGAVAVHYKFRADGVDDRYRDPEGPGYADEALRQDAIRLDRRSAVALGAMQVGVGVLAVRFVLR